MSLATEGTLSALERGGSRLFIRRQGVRSALFHALGRGSSAGGIRSGDTTASSGAFLRGLPALGRLAKGPAVAYSFSVRSPVKRPNARPGAECLQPPPTAAPRQEEARRASFVAGVAAAAAAEHVGSPTAAFSARCRAFRAPRLEVFRAPANSGPPPAPKRAAARARVIQLRNQTDSADDRQPRVRVDGLGLSVTRREPSRREQGVAKWPRRRDGARALTGLPERAEPTTIAASAWNPWPSVETAAAGGLVVVPLVVA